MTTRLCTREPPPQDREHAEKGPQLETWQSTVAGVGFGVGLGVGFPVGFGVGDRVGTTVGGAAVVVTAGAVYL